LAVAALLSACGAIEQQSSLVRPAVAGRPYVAGVGDTVMDLKLTESLPNVFGKADLYGRTRDAGRVTVRLVGLDGDQAVFVRQDVVIQSNETTLSQGPMVLPTYQSSTMSGTIGTAPVSATRNTWGVTYAPPVSAYSYPIQSGETQIAAPIGGSVLIEGRRLKVLRGVDGGIEYSVD
jgi:hypothetical protein